VDERTDVVIAQAGPTLTVASFAGHGTHVAGIIAATSNNDLGIVGAAWHSSLMIAKTSHLTTVGPVVSSDAFNTDIIQAIIFLVDRGAQIINMSFGGETTGTTIMSALEYAAHRGVMMVAASGNNKAAIQSPANAGTVIAVGGLQDPGLLWDEGPACPAGTDGCGSCFGPEQELVAPARQVLSTFYTGMEWNPTCSDSTFPAAGYGLCTGTSMAAPHVVGLVGLVRSVDPLLPAEAVRSLLHDYASQAGNPTPELGYGVPDAGASVRAALGQIGGHTIANRLTPLFSFYSPVAEDHFYTTVAQMGSAAVSGSISSTNISREPDPGPVFYGSVGPPVPGYDEFPDIPPCLYSPCTGVPRASVYLFTSDKPPDPAAVPLVPLYRLSYQSVGGPPYGWDHFYTTQTTGILAARSAGYFLDGIEGYLHPPCDGSCSSSCAPAGTVPLLRRYNPTRDDHALFPESELVEMLAAGYTAVVGGLSCIGHVYPNLDSDLDALIDGFETLIGTDPFDSDSDCDGLADGMEVLDYPRTDPLGSLCPGDLIFADEFDAGNLSAWSGPSTVGTGLLAVTAGAALSGTRGLAVTFTAGGTACVADQSPKGESRYRARFLLAARPDSRFG